MGLIEQKELVQGSDSKQNKIETNLIVEQLMALVKDPEVLKRAEELHQKITYLTPEDLLKRFRG